MNCETHNLIFRPLCELLHPKYTDYFMIGNIVMLQDGSLFILKGKMEMICICSHSNQYKSGDFLRLSDNNIKNALATKIQLKTELFTHNNNECVNVYLEPHDKT